MMSRNNSGLRRCVTGILVLTLGWLCVPDRAEGGRPTVQTHPDFKQGKLGIQTMTIVPPMVLVAIYTDTGIEPRPQLSTDAETMIVRVAQSVLRSRGYEMVSSQITPEALVADTALNLAYRELKDRLTRYYDARMTNVGGTARGDHSLGPITALFGERANADALVFILAVGIQLSGVTMPTFLLSDGFIYNVTVVEARSGTVIFETPTFGTAIPRSEFKDIKGIQFHVVRSLTDALQKLPRRQSK